jgi:hypothetical protein
LETGDKEVFKPLDGGFETSVKGFRNPEGEVLNPA